MNKQHWILFVGALAIMAGGSGLILRLQAKQTLGKPGLKTSPLAGTQNLQVEFPENVPGYTSKPIEISKPELEILPNDTSFGRRSYRSDGGFEVLMSAVLMGSDRTSIHQPQFCLVGQGFRLDQQEETTIPIQRPSPYQLPVMKITATKTVSNNGQVQTGRGLYVYWFVAEDRMTSSHSRRMWWMAEELLKSGTLQRWAYVSCFAVCLPGQEEAACKQMEDLISKAVPEFQLNPGSDR